MTIGNRIRTRRELLGISQTELAEKIKVSKQTLYKYEKNIVTNIPSDKIEALSKFLNVSEAYLMGWEENSELIPDILADKPLLECLKKIMCLNNEHRQTIYDNATYWYEKEGH